jgi:CO/xanthine dehydrogenase Mo-binding subunit
MSTPINRRTFLKASALSGGGLMLGFNWLAACSDATQEAAPAAINWQEINAYLRIGTDGSATILSPNPEIGQGVKTAMPMIVAEELGIPWAKVTVEQAPLSGAFERQVAGGSQSIRSSWDALRTAGATAREMLRQAAANRWEVPLNEVVVENGALIHTVTTKKLHYGEVATEAAALPVPAAETLSFKQPKDYRIIGHGQKNVDNGKIVTGQPLFGLDIVREGMQYAMVVRPPAFGATLVGVDGSQALAMPGISHVFALEDRVAIVGSSTWAVMKGRKALQIEWKMPTQPENTAQQRADMQALLGKASAKPARQDGDIELAFRQATKVVEADYSCPFLPHNTLEPMNFFADVQPDHAELIGPTQTPAKARQVAAEITGLSESQITVDMTRMGGGFGRRLDADYVADAVAISHEIKQPVKVIWTREDDMTAGKYRHLAQYRYRAALDDRNELTGFHIRGVTANFPRAVFPDNFPAAAVSNYQVENHQFDSAVSTYWWRSPIHNFLAVAEQSFLDEVAEAAGKDPVVFRLDLLTRAQEAPVGKLDYDPARLAATIELVAKQAGWFDQREGVYLGFASYYSHNSYAAEIAEVVLEDGALRLQKMYCAIDCGIVINPEGARNQVQGGVIDGLGHALFSEMTIEDGRPQANNFHQYRLIRQKEVPPIEVYFVENEEHPTGLGEPSLPPAPAALANAIYKATGQRLRHAPFLPQLAAQQVELKLG